MFILSQSSLPQLWAAIFPTCNHLLNSSSDPNEAKGSKMEPKVIGHPSQKVPIESNMELLLGGSSPRGRRQRR